MRNIITEKEETIVALATPPGTGAIGVIRLSGDQAISITDSVFPAVDLLKVDSHTVHYGHIVDKTNEVLDEVLISIFHNPRSYTKEDVVEISCHGSPYIQQQVLQLLIQKGARLANPGEFTLRAFLNGRVDLSQAEAVADLIASDSKSSHDNALKQMRGGFSLEIKKLRDELIHFASLLELELDFSEEDIEFVSRNELSKLLNKIAGLLKSLVDSFLLGNVIKNGVSTVIAGRPNAGKSTLLNKLTNEDRAIVSEIPGTTRDVIEEVINIKGIQFRLVDTAGIRDAGDIIEAMGIEKTMEKIRQSAVLIYLFDVTSMSEENLKSDLEKLHYGEVPVLLLGNKIDLAEKQIEEKYSSFKNNILFISSKEGINIENLKESLYQLIISGEFSSNDSIITNTRHIEALNLALKAIDDVKTGFQNEISSELVALDIRRVLDFMGQITGEVTNDDLLGNIFGKFCIGK